MSPIKLTDSELDAVMRAAEPLEPHQRDAFLQAVAAELSHLGDQIGPGSVHRVVRQLQRQYFDPPALGHGDYAKYR
jgi:hypothetical protein